MVLLRPACELLNALGIRPSIAALAAGFAALILAAASGLAELYLVIGLLLLFYFSISSMILLSADLDRSVEILKHLSTDVKASELDLTGVTLVSLDEQWSQGITEYRRQKDHFDNAISEIGFSSKELMTTSRSLAENIQEQSRSTQSIAAAVTEISYSIDEIAQRVSALSTSADSTNCQSAEGKAAIADVKANMTSVATLIATASERLSELVQETKDVSSVTSIIKDIAEQTNLLALNAAIEAARAGEQGRGFSVVADEVRILANRSLDLADSISESMRSVQEKMSVASQSMDQVVAKNEHTHEVADNAESVFEHIVTNNRAISETISVIAEAVEQQNLATKEISENIETVAQVAATNTEVSMQSSQVAEHLNRLCSREVSS